MSINLKPLLGLIAAGALLAGCDNNDDDNGTPLPPEQITYLRVIHASPDAPNVNVTKDGTVLAPGLGLQASVASRSLHRG